MTLDEIVQMHRDILEKEDDRATNDLIGDLISGFCWGLEKLCAERPDVAANALEILATSPDWGERQTAGCLLRHLAASNHGAAMILSETLIRDPDLQTRESALISLYEGRETGVFSLTDALHLLRLYNSVEVDNAGEGTEDSYHAYAKPTVQLMPPERER
jgi:hypothetical protein